MAIDPATGNYTSGTSGYTQADVDEYLRQLSERTGASVESDDAEKLLAKLEGGDAYITEAGGDPNLAFQEFSDQYARRGASQRTGDGPDSADLVRMQSGGSSGGSGSAGNFQWQQMMDAIRGMAGGNPDVDLSSINPGALPNIEVQGANLTPTIDQNLIELMNGSDPLGLQGYLQNLLSRTAGGSVDSVSLQNRLEQARENLTRGEEGALADIRGTLADRGLLSLPGAPEGVEADATSRAFLPLQREYLSNVRSIESDERQTADERELQALQAATGWTRDQAASRLAATNEAGGRQKMFAEVAARQLEDNMAWNEFLATFGLQREQVMEDIRQGRIENIMPFIQMFLALVGQSSGGYI